MSSHDKIVKKALAAVKNADREAIVGAFVGSLSSHNLPARSAFGSLMVLEKFKAHPYAKSKEFDEDVCAYCGLAEDDNRDNSDLDDLIDGYPFQAHHWEIDFAAQDLATFSKRDVDEPTPESVACLRGLLDAIRSLPATAQLTELDKGIAKAIKSNKHERMKLLETLGFAGVLCPKAKQHYGTKFVTYDDASSDQPKEFFKQEWAYPVRFWTGKDGVDEKIVKSLFGSFFK